jgi:hypothetical protein
MISLAIATALYATSMQSTAVLPRKQYSECLNKAVKKNLTDKTDPTSFPAAARTACAAEATAFKAALVTYDVKAGTRRTQAEQDANLQIEDYLNSALETYKVFSESGAKPD